MIHGENLILAINGTPLAASKSCSLSKSQSFIEYCSPTDGRWEASIPKKLSWNISSDCLLGTMDAYKALDAAWKAGTLLSVQFYDTEYNEYELGKAYINSLNLDASKGNLAKMSISIKGSGALRNYSDMAINIDRTTIAEDKEYVFKYNAIYGVKATTGCLITEGTLTITERTLVEIVTYNNLIFLSRNSDMEEKARNLQDLTPEDYEIIAHYAEGRKRVWLDAGTWYVVESKRGQTETPTYTIIG